MTVPVMAAALWLHESGHATFPSHGGGEFDIFGM